MKKRFIYIAVALALLVGIILPSVAFAANTSTGSFEVENSAPTVGTITSESPWSPHAEWTTITVPVTDLNSLVDVKEVKATVFYDALGTDVNAAPGSADTYGKTCAILTWTRGGTYTITQGASSTTWGINIAGCSKGTDTNTSGDWVFSFRIGDVATKAPNTTDTSADWDVYAVATDVADATGNARLNDIVMNQYLAVTVTTGVVEFGTVAMDSGFAYDVNKEHNISVNYIANCAYQAKVNSDSTWTHNTNVATFDNDGTATANNHFSLKAVADSSTVTDADTFTANAKQVTTAGVQINTGAQTLEGGNTLSDNALWLRVAPIFIADTYSGTITYTISTN